MAVDIELTESPVHCRVDIGQEVPVRRVAPSPVLDLVPMLGLSTVVIALLLVAWSPPVAMIETSRPFT